MGVFRVLHRDDMQIISAWWLAAHTRSNSYMPKVGESNTAPWWVLATTGQDGMVMLG